MRSPCSVTIALAVAVAVPTGAGACRAPEAADDEPGPAADAGADAAEGPGCSARSPRTVMPETFVGPTGLQARLTGLIDGAQSSLDVAMYLFTVNSLADRIIAAKNRGVAVRVMLDPDHPGNDSIRARLVQAGVPNRNAPSIYTYSHAKYFIVDKQAAVIMSMNFNAGAMDSERNYGLVDRDPDDVADARAVFEMDWAGGGGEPPKPADLSCTRLIVSPTNSKTRILDLIARATSTLDIEAIYVADTEVRDAIAAAKTRGVAIRVILEPTEDNTATIAFFSGRGIPVRSANGFYNHAKLVISDGVAFVGSENFSVTALTRNREMGALVFEPTAAAKIQQQFAADWGP
jgi:phosphatidylserine/phosphatidylglycerophosphate/cardiolipin synthase-like enzyme